MNRATLYTDRIVCTDRTLRPRRRASALLPLAFLLGVICLSTRSADAIVYVNRSNANDPNSAAPVTLNTQTWTAANSPYIVEARVTVGFGTTLTIQPGVQVQFDGPHGFYVAGKVLADGTAASRIIFTTRNRPSADGGDWLGIALSSDASGSLLDNVEIRYAGALAGLGASGGNRKAALYTNTADVTITNCRILSSETNGIETVSSAGLGGGSQQESTVQNCVFENVRTGYYAILCDDVNCFLNVSGNSATGTGYLGIGLGSGEIDSGNTWRRGGADFPYFMRGTVEVPFQRTLTVNAGVTVKALGAYQIWVLGSLKADGSAASPITFTSGKSPAARGDWNGIYFGDSIGPNCLLDYCNIAYAANGVRIGNSDPVITNCTFSEMSVCGITVAQPNYANPPRATIQNNTFQDFNLTAYAIIYENMYTFPIISGNNAVNLFNNGIKLPGGTITQSTAVYPKPGNLAYFLVSNMTIGSSAGLTIPAGNTFKIASTAGIYANGRLQILGSEAEPVLLMASGLAIPTQPYWDGIRFSSTSDASVINYCEIRHAGSALGAASGTSAIRAEVKPVVMDHLRVRFPLGHGIRLRDSDSAVAASTFEGVEAPNAAVLLETSDTFPSVTGNTASGTGRLGIVVKAGTVSAGKIGTWEKGGEDFPWLVDGDYTIPNTSTLNISAGTTVKLAGGLYLNGTLSATGTAAEPILLTSLKTSAAPGDWRGLYIGPTSSFSSISNIIIAYAGSDTGLGTYHGSLARAALYLDANDLNLTNIQVLHSEVNGIELYDSASAIRSSLIWDCGGAGIAANGAAGPAIQNCTIVGCDEGLFTTAGFSMDSTIIASNNTGIRKPTGGKLAVLNNTLFDNTTRVDGIVDFIGAFGNNDVDPLFAAPGIGNFRLKPGSPAIDTGSNAGVPAGAKDLDGKNRIIGTIVDRGAYEASAFLPYTFEDVVRALRISGGLIVCQTADMVRLNVVADGDSASAIDLRDADRLGRHVAGTSPL